MQGNVDIEITRLRRNKHTMLILLVCMIVAVMFFMAFPKFNDSQSQYGVSKSDSNVFMFSEDQVDALEQGITSEEWSVSKDSSVSAGTTIEKNCVVENQVANCYLRVNFRVVDRQTGNVLDPTTEDKARLEKIVNMLYYDKASSLVAGNSYTQAELRELLSEQRIFRLCSSNFEPVVANDDVALNGWDESSKAYRFNYVKGDDLNVFKKNNSLRIFTDLVVPTDYTEQDLNEVGDFSINVWVQGIASDHTIWEEAFDNF